MDVELVNYINERDEDLRKSLKAAIKKVAWLNKLTKPYDVSLDTFSPLKTWGYIDSFNLSSEYTKLIQLAAKYCESFASDILIDIKSLEEWLPNSEEKEEKIFFFGFRENGCDHEAFCEARAESSHFNRTAFKAEYRALYAWYFKRGNDNHFESVLVRVQI